MTTCESCENETLNHLAALSMRPVCNGAVLGILSSYGRVYLFFCCLSISLMQWVTLLNEVAVMNDNSDKN